MKSITGEEIANAVTHGVGALLAVAGLVLLIVFAALEGTVWHIVGFSVFGAAMVILYTASTVYHSVVDDQLKKLFRKVDHMAIYLLIAGTYTPFCLTVLNGWIGWTFLGIIWGCALAGIIVKAFLIGKNERLSTYLYIAMGWMCIIAAKPLYDALSASTLVFLITGGLLYTIGTIFYLKDKISYFHSIWHLFVLGGTVMHFFSVLTLL